MPQSPHGVEDTDPEDYVHHVGDVTLTIPNGQVAVTMLAAEWVEVLADMRSSETCWQLGGWIQERAADSWGLYGTDTVTVTYSDGTSETVQLRRTMHPGTSYGDGRGAYTKLLTDMAPQWLGQHGIGSDR